MTNPPTSYTTSWDTTLALAEALDRRQLQLARAPLGTGRDRRHEGRFARRAAAPLAAGAHSAEIGVVHLHPPP